MENKKYNRAQIGVEYLIIISFVTFAIITIFIIAILYSGEVKERIRLNQAESFSTQLINSAEAVFFAGEPSKTVVSLYLPDGVKNLEINQNELVVTVTTSSGDNKRAYTSKVPINGTISTGEGIKKLSLEAKDDFVLIS